MQPVTHTPATSPINYDVHGYSTILIQIPCSSGFNGECFDVHTHCYHLGQGHRVYSPALKRFTRPDFLSPFGRGGVNSYAYCNGDPINFIDPHGTNGVFQRSLKWIGTRKFRKHSRVDMSHARSNAKLAGEMYEKEILSYEQKRKENVIGKLKYVSTREPDLFDNVVQYLPPGALHKATRHLWSGDPLAKWAQRISDEAYVNHHSKVLRGDISYHADGRLNSSAVFRLKSLEESILKANRPYTFVNSQDYVDPEAELELSISKANKLRRKLERLRKY